MSTSDGTVSPLALARRHRPKGVVVRAAGERDAWLAMRAQDVTASAAGALLGVSPYLTPFGLHAIKAGLATDDVDSEPAIGSDAIIFPPAARGLDFEPVVIRHVFQLRPHWRISYPLKRYWRMPAARIGATPDALAIDPEQPGFGVLQIKTTSDFLFDKSWRDPDTRELTIPLWIAVQALVEAKVTGASWAAVAVMMTGLRTETHLIPIPLHDRLWQRVQDEVSAFWKRIEAGTLPDPDFNRDGRVIAQMFADPAEAVAEIPPEKAERLVQVLRLRAELKGREAIGSAAERERKALDSEIIFTLGNSVAGLMPDGQIIRAAVSRRVSLDADIIRKEMGEAWAAARSKHSSYRTVTVKGSAA